MADRPWRDRVRKWYKVCWKHVKRRSEGRFAREHLTYFRLHLAYFIALALVGTFILREIGIKHRTQFKWIDALYCFTSAICLSGLSTVPVEDIRTGGQVILFFGMILGGSVFTSLVPLLVKRHRYFKVVKHIVEQPSEASEASKVEGSVRKRKFSRSDPGSSSMKDIALNRLRRISQSMLMRSEEDRWMEEMARKHERVVEGGSLKEIVQEFRATIALTKLVVCYYVVVQLVGFFIAWGSILGSPHAKRVLAAKKVNTGFFALFAIVSGFSNCGYILANENMVALNTSSVLMLDIFAVVLLGNTLYPPALRLVVWIMYKWSKGRSKEAYKFLLDHPRKCYTHLFPLPTTLWLTTAVGVLIGFQALMFFILDWNGRALKGMDTGHKIVIGLFDASGTRTSGMNSVNLMDISPAILLLYCGMMYISAYPIFLSRQHTRIQEESEKDAAKHAAQKGSMGDLHDITISTQSRRLLARDWTYLFFALFCICIAENKKMERDPVNFSVFSIIFEIISAYGSVGLSLGYSCSSRIQSGPCTDVPYSFSGKCNYISKVIIIVVMFLGRHRGLPDNIDSAIILPDSKYGSLVLLKPLVEAEQQQQHTAEHRGIFVIQEEEEQQQQQEHHENPGEKSAAAAPAAPREDFSAENGPQQQQQQAHQQNVDKD